MNCEVVRARIMARSDVQTEGPAKGCWFWTAAVNVNGYGRVTIDGDPWRAHRAAWAAFNGPIPEGKVVRHVCGFRTCVNPAHLKIGSQRANVWDSIESGTFAPRGCRMSPRTRPQEVEQ